MMSPWTILSAQLLGGLWPVSPRLHRLRAGSSPPAASSSDGSIFQSRYRLGAIERAAVLGRRFGLRPLARRLLEAGASLEARDRFGTMPLARAARVGHVALIELFLS